MIKKKKWPLKRKHKLKAKMEWNKKVYSNRKKRIMSSLLIR
jgi:hypothetical protein